MEDIDAKFNVEIGKDERELIDLYDSDEEMIAELEERIVRLEYP